MYHQAVHRLAFLPLHTKISPTLVIPGRATLREASAQPLPAPGAGQRPWGSPGRDAVIAVVIPVRRGAPGPRCRLRRGQENLAGGEADGYHTGCGSGSPRPLNGWRMQHERHVHSRRLLQYLLVLVGPLPFRCRGRVGPSPLDSQGKGLRLPGLRTRVKSSFPRWHDELAGRRPSQGE